MGEMQDLGQLRRSLVLRIALPLSVLIIFGLIGSIWLIKLAAIGQDERARAREVQTVEAAIHAQCDLMLDMLRSHAVAPHAAFAETPQGAELLQRYLRSDLTTFDIDGAVAVDGNAQVTAAFGRAGQPMDLARARRMLAPIIADVTEMSRIMATVTGIVLWEGVPALMVATSRVPDPSDIGPSNAMSQPMLIYFDQIDAAFLRGIARDHGLPGLYLGAPIGDQAAVPLRDISGKLLTSLVWEPFRPGMALLDSIIPSILAIFGVLTLASVAVAWFARHAAALIHASEVRALLDPLTGLPNRFLLEDRLQRVLLAMQRSHGRLTLLYLDLDGFKAVNDTFGHAAGDDLLRQASARLRGLVRDMDTVARIGGDEFVILQPGECSPASVHHVCIRLIDGLAEPFTVEGRDVTIGVSIGAACAPADGAEVSLLVRRADEAMYHAKRAGRGRYHRWTAEANVAPRAASPPRPGDEQARSNRARQDPGH